MPTDAPEGLCPSCLAKEALGSEPVNPGTRIPPDVTHLAAQFPQLEIIELLGMGGMGMVYKALQPRLDRLVALKILPVASMPDASFGERFEREAKALARLNYPGIVSVYDFGQTREYYFFIMEFVDGMNLRQLIQAKTMEPRQALELVTQICTALQFAHDEKIVHRDIKPENILITKKGQVKIVDFGLAKLLGTAPDISLTASQTMMGTLNYMAPEQRENTKNVDHRADIYSLGVVFYEMLTGEVPMGRFEAPSKKVRIDVRLDEVVLHALEREPARRYQHVSEIKSGVENITSTMPREKPAAAAPEICKPKPPPGFVPFVLKRFTSIALVWLGIALCLHWAIGDSYLTLSSDQHISISQVIYHCIGAVLCLMFSLGLARLVLPVIFLFVVFAWLVKRLERGLTMRQLPPNLRPQFRQRSAVMAACYAVMSLGVCWLINSSNTKMTEKTEWWFVPTSGAYEKLGFLTSFSRIQNFNKTNSEVYYEAPPTGTISLIVHRKQSEPAVLNLTLPGLRADTTKPYVWTFVLDKDSLADWLRKGAGLDAVAPHFQDEAGEIYALFKEYQNEPPHTAKEFADSARADLKHFSVGGMTSNTNWITAYKTGNWVVGGFLCGFILLYLAGIIWNTRRTFNAAWAEIEAGRWTPPAKIAKRFPTNIKALFAFSPIPLGLGFLAGIMG
jgi:serine/threonine protein kinase